MENDEQKRYKNGYDTVNLLPEDAIVSSPEEEIGGLITFRDIVASLQSDREKFIALALFAGFNKAETARMLKVHPAKVNLVIKEMRIELQFYINQT